MSGNAAAALTGTHCHTITVEAEGSSAGAVAKFRDRRAERRAKSAWEKKVKKAYGSDHANIDDATITKSVKDRTLKGNAKYIIVASFKFCR